jgi:hypothetical protein
LIISVGLRPGLNSRLPDERPMVSLAWVVPGCFTYRVLMRTSIRAIAPILCWPSRM